MDGEGRPPRVGARNLLSLLLLAGWCWFAAVFGPELGLPGTDLPTLLGGLAGQAAWFVPIGVLIPLVLPRMRSLLGKFGFVLVPSVGIGLVLVTLVAAAPDSAPWRVLDEFRFPGIFPLLAPAAGMFAGVLLGVILGTGLASALVAIPALVAIGAILLAIAAVALLALTDRVAAADPLGRGGAANASVPLRFETDAAGAPVLDPANLAVNFRRAALAAGLSPEFRAAAAPRGDGVDVTVSLPVGVPLLGERFLNITLEAQPSVQGGVFRMGVRTLRVGALTLPPASVRFGSRILSRWVREGSPLAPLLVALRGPADLAAAAPGKGEPPGPVPPASTELGVRVADHLGELERAAEAIRARPDRLAGALEHAFGFAGGRSGRAGAVEENRAALLALGGAVGHAGLLQLAGVPAMAAPARKVGSRLGITLRGRADWARHFFLSAGLTQIGPAGLSGDAGLFKERPDAAGGGSGFSFGDLLVDAAGTRFGVEVTASEAGAARLQRRIASGIAERDLVPAASGLPEGLSLEQIESDYGGVGGAGFRALEAEIHRRVDDLPLYR